MGKKKQQQKTPDKTVRFFSSHEEMEEHKLRRMAARSHGERLSRLEEMRKVFLSQHLLPDGSWPPLERTITITNRGQG